MHTLDQRLVQTVPSARQLRLQRMEFYAFVHFGMNTFTDREWGDGTEQPSVFNPEKLDARQWVDAVKAAGMTGLILTCKHHDGFCLWPSHCTDHTVSQSPYKAGRGDIVGEVAEACREGGIRFGVYLSPWDRNQPLYGSGKPYDDFFVAQLTELLTNYGEVFCVWFDGACGEGPNGKKQYYDWNRYYETIRRLQPEACIHVCGPDIRWCGNEAGDTRQAEWSVVPKRTADTEKIASQSQQADDTAFRRRTIHAEDRDLGSRELLADEEELIWYPAEVNTSIRPGWFWHESENDSVRPLAKLIDIYEKSVGGNATFLLNIPPTTDGLIHENDVRRLREFGQYLKEGYGRNLTAQAAIEADGEADCLRTDDETFCMLTGEKQIVIRWDEAQTIRRIVLREQIRLSQRVERFAVDALQNGEWQTVYEGTVIGCKRIVPLKNVCTSAVRIRILDSWMAPALSFAGIYE